MSFAASLELHPVELTKLWHAPYAERMAYVSILLETAQALPMLRRRFEVVAATIRGLPEAKLPADRYVVAVVHTSAGDVWVRGPAAARHDDVVGEVSAKIKLEGVPGINPDGPTLVEIEEALPHWRELAEIETPEPW